jgi:hypothetical protein
VRAVWSFWSKPYYGSRGWGWDQPVHHLLAWGLSLEVARRHYPSTVLVTDGPGKALLVDELGLSFAEVSTDLDALADADPGIWALGKLVAYSRQEAPFVHIDADAFLWRPLPDRLESAPVFAQHMERWPVGASWLHPELLENAFADHGLSLPVEWVWARSHWGNLLYEENCGVVGGNDTDFLRYYAGVALDLVLNPLNAPGWEAVTDSSALTMLIEQFLLTACAEYHRSNPRSSFRGINISHLFPSQEAAFNPAYASRVGFTHLLGDSKRDPRVTLRLEQRVESEDPAFYRRCVELCGAQP